MQVEVNQDALEPNDYFKILKEGMKEQEKEELEKQLEVLSSHILSAKKIGQKTFWNACRFHIRQSRKNKFFWHTDTKNLSMWILSKT